MTDSRKLRVGSIVHYVSYGTPGGEYASECRAAIVTEIPVERLGLEALKDVVGLAILNPTGFFFNRAIPYSADPLAGGSWHWPDWPAGA